jgi:uncharacterized protein
MSRRFLLTIPLLALLPLVGCETEPAQTAEPPRQVTTPRMDDHPLAAIPREELYGAGPAENLWSPKIEIEVLNLPRGWDGARFAIVSDLQLGRWPENEQVALAAVQHALAQRPDVVVLLGDFLVPEGEIESLRRVLAPLNGQRVVAALGSQDVRSDSVEALVTGTLREANVQVLMNNSVPLEIRGDTAWIGGIDPDILRMTFGDQQWIFANLGETGRTPIVITHNAAMATRAPMRRFPVYIAGNTYCGEIEMPGTPRLSWLRDEVFPQGGMEGSDRLFRVQGGTLIATCGVGYGFVPLRFGAPPEVPILTLRRVGPPQETAETDAVDDEMIERFQPQQQQQQQEETQPPPQ